MLKTRLDLSAENGLEDTRGKASREKPFRTEAWRIPRTVILSACILGLSGTIPVGAAEAFSDPGFVSELITTLPTFGPVGVAWALDGRMFIWQKNGIVRVFKNGSLLSTPFLDFSSKVNTFNDNGMWGLAFDPDFSNNGFIYLTYMFEPNGNPNDNSPKIARLVRVTANSASPDVMLAGSEVILLDNLPDTEGTHSVGSIRFAPDGKMFVGNGDGASPSFVDLDAYGAQDLDNVRGKIFRINADGTAPTDNPFYDGTDSVRSKVWCYGVRNPYRFSLHPATGEPYFADVGWNDWEEIDRGIRGGNFGWPCYEGNGPQTGYQSALPQCAALSAVVAPIVTYSHGNGDLGQGGTCIVGGDFYRGNLYPSAYQDNYFYADYSGNWIHRLVLDGNGNVASAAPFATGIVGPTCVEQGPDGYLYYVVFSSGQIRRIRYNGPAAVASATPAYGYSPLQVTFSSAGSTNSGGGSLTYSWAFGDGTTSTLPNPTHTYNAAGVTTFTATLTVRNSNNLTSSATVKVTVGSLPPTPSILTPADGTGFMPGQTVFFQGSAIDPDDGVLGPGALKWTILVHHNTHVHTFVSGSGSQGSFVVEDHGTIGTFYYEILLTATDSSGLATVTNVNIPVLLDAILPTIPANLAATPAGSFQINLSWSPSTDNAAVSGYLVERQGGGNPSFVQIGTSTGAAYNDAGLAAGTSYSYRLRAMDASGNLSDYSIVAGATTADPPPTLPGLVAAYSFSEGTGTAISDASGNGNSGTISGATWTTAGKYGNGLSFSGASLVTINDSVSLRLTTGMTLEAWVYPTSASSVWRDVIYKADDIYYLEGTSTSSGVPAMGGTFSASPLYGTGALAVNTWAHLAATYDGATMRLYVNGVQVASRAQTGNIVTSTDPLQIGGDSLYGQYWSGMIDEVRVYNRALSVAEIQTDMNTPVGGSPPPNTAPTISDIADRAVNEDADTGAIAFTVGDAETAAGSLTVSGSSSNPTLVPTANIVFAGSGANRTVTVTPAANQNGSATITVTVSDGALTASDTFVLAVNAVNDAPTISNIADQSTTMNTATAAIAFTVGDIETAAGSLTVSGSSSNPTLVPNANIVFGGSGASRTVTVTPAANQTGTATITMTVSDGSLTANDTFVLTVSTSVSGTVSFTNATVISIPSQGAATPYPSTINVTGMAGTISKVTVTLRNLSHTNPDDLDVLLVGPGGQKTLLLSDAGGSGDLNNLTFVFDDSASASLSNNGQLAGGTFKPSNYDTSSDTFPTPAPAGPYGVFLSVFNGLTANGSWSLYVRDDRASDAGSMAGGWSLAVTTVSSAPQAPTISDIPNQTTTVNTATPAVAFNIGDTDTPVGILTLSGSSSNPTLVPNANIVFGGSGGNRTVTVTPAADQTGTATITVTVSDGVLTASDTFVLTVTAVNTAPTISDITDRAVNEDADTGAIVFTVGDAETAPGSLTVSGSSSDPTLVTNGNIVFGGSGANRTVTVTPAANQNGSATITVTVSDGALTASDTFVLAVNAVNDAPTISNIADQSTTMNTATAAIAFTVGDIETAAGSLTVSGSSSNPTLAPNANIVFGGSGASRTVTVTPAANQTGTATITMTVSDGSLTANDTFVLTVTATPTGLVAAYGFNEGIGTGVTDASGNSNNGTISAATWTTSGKYGGALSFNGTSARVTVNDVASLRLTTGMTLEAWVFPTSASSVWRDVIYKADDNYYLEGTSTTSGRPAMGGTFGAPLYGTGALTVNTWAHLAATYDGATMRLYVNGVQVASRAQTGDIATSTNPLQIGGDSLYGQYFAGRIDEVRVYNRALSVAEIQTDMNSPVP